MQKNSYGLIGAGLVAVLVGLGLYWNATQSGPQSPASDTAVMASNADAGGQTKPQASELDTKQPEAEPSRKAQQPASDKAASSGETVKDGEDSQTPKKQESEVSAQQVKTPVFDILRVDRDGSVVIAGKATPNSNVEVVAGARVVGAAKAGANGDFAVVLDNPLKPGDHQLVLRARNESRAVTSAETAIVSVPATEDGQVLALVEAPGQASRLITRPDTKPAAQSTASATAPDAAKSEPDAPTAPIAIEAVEIEGGTVFVAGKAEGGSRVIVHANAILLGAAALSPEGRFLIESPKDLPVADYIVRADLLDNSDRVIATARVPFRRDEGANIAAVAPGEGRSRVSADDEAAPLQKAQGSVIIRKGDNLWTISKRTYGKGARYTTIYLANRDQIGNPDLILPGQVFTMPKEALSPEEAERRLRGPLQ
ncbi:Ig-like domain-containing protein [Brucella sp. BE17]|uniref:Ig-like domain-containing protein n=1 Tax=Brucella sp. BE17 TaxID=3142977 RepID=UPI0031BB7375